MSNPTSKEQLLVKLKAVDSKLAKQSLITLLEHYINPAFGSLPKREVDIAIFHCLQELGVFDSTPEVYSLLSSLRISRTKARTLLYESNLRKSSSETLEFELVNVLLEPLLKDNDKVCLEVGNPLLIDHIKYELKELNHISDSSFSPELIKITPEAYKALLNKKLAKVSKKEIDAALIKCGAKKEMSAKIIFKEVIKKVGKKVADDAGKQAGELVGDYLGDLISGTTEQASTFLSKYVSDKKGANKK